MSQQPDRVTLARIVLNQRSREARRDLRDATEMHRTLMRMVPDGLGDTPRQTAGLLYRVDVADTHTAVLVQATTELDPATLPADYGRTQVKDLAAMFASLSKGLGVRYRITANPTKRARAESTERTETTGRTRPPGRVVPLAGHEADEWWTRQAAVAGLELRTGVATPVQPVRSRREAAKGMRHSLVRFDGTATVTDPDALAEAVRRGIGRGKSYGAGLLSLAPARGE